MLQNLLIYSKLLISDQCQMTNSSRQLWIGCTSGNIRQKKLGMYCKISSLGTFQDQQRWLFLDHAIILDCTFHALMNKVR